MSWPCSGGHTGSFAGTAAADPVAYFTGDAIGQGSQLGFWLWVSSSWAGSPVVLFDFDPTTSGQPAWNLILDPTSGLTLTYAQASPSAWSFGRVIAFPGRDCWSWFGLSAGAVGDGTIALDWTQWRDDGAVTAGGARPPGPPTSYAITASGQLSMGARLTSLGDPDAVPLGTDGNVKLSKALYNELVSSNNQQDPVTGLPLVGPIDGYGDVQFLLPRSADWPVMIASHAANCSGAPGAFSGSFASAGQGYNWSTTGPSNGYIYPDGPDIPPQWLRLAHKSGQAYWQTRGDITQEWVGGAMQVSWPLGTMSSPPLTIMGLDPNSHLPAYGPAPQFTPTDPPPTTPLPIPHQNACGAADQMMQNLTNLYSNIAGLARTLFDNIAISAVDQLKDAVFSVIAKDPLVLGELQLPVAFLAFSLSNITIPISAWAALPDIFSFDQFNLRCLIFNQIGSPDSNGNITITDTMVSSIVAGITGSILSGGAIEATVMQWIASHIPLATWQRYCNIGLNAPSGLCETCP